MRYGECYVALRSQRTNHVLHCEYTSTGENLPFLEEEYEVATENGGFQMNGRKWRKVVTNGDEVAELPFVSRHEIRGGDSYFTRVGEFLCSWASTITQSTRRGV